MLEKNVPTSGSEGGGRGHDEPSSTGGFEKLGMGRKTDFPYSLQKEHRLVHTLI